MSRTRTGIFPIGFRRIRGGWQNDLGALLRWAKEKQFETVDLGWDAEATAKTVLAAGLRLGSVDLAVWQGMISPDRATRDAALARNTAYVRACTAVAGPLNYFLVMLPENPDLPRAQNFAYMVDSFRRLAPVLEECESRIVIEGWPGPGALCCTPETCRAFFREVPSRAMGFNYDPSHLIRMGIDPLRFLREFGDRVHHVHAKDTELLSEGLYECGNFQPTLSEKRIPFGAPYWRYTIPGNGGVKWGEVFTMLVSQGYKGCISVELEDICYNGSESGEKEGLVKSREFLEGC